MTAPRRISLDVYASIQKTHPIESAVLDLKIRSGEAAIVDENGNEEKTNV
jgi:hypothetical protein